MGELSFTNAELLALLQLIKDGTELRFVPEKQEEALASAKAKLEANFETRL